MKIPAFVAAILLAALAAAPASAQTTSRNFLRFTVVTGNDDLRGGRDNVMASYRHGETWTTPRILNRGQRWPDNSTRQGRIDILEPMQMFSLNAIRLQTTFRGGFDGDNWNMASVLVEACALHPSGREICREVGRHGFKRFTGDERELIFATRPLAPESSGPKD